MLPTHEALFEGLAAALGRPVEIVRREPHLYASSFPAEVIRCREEGREELRMLGKYEIRQPRTTYGHRGGVDYERFVYEKLLARLSLSHVTFMGATAEAGTGATWLFLEYLGDGVRADEVDDPAQALRTAAAWIGDFQRLSSGLLDQGGLDFLHVHDRDYYAGWAGRAAVFAERAGVGASWLPLVRDRIDHVADVLLSEPRSVIHGEFTPHNVLIRAGRAHPVDWESAAIGAGETDIVSLTQKWPAEVVSSCEEAYAQARGLGELDPVRVDAARIYWDLRWLGDRPEWLSQPKVRARLDFVRDAAERLGIL